MPRSSKILFTFLCNSYSQNNYHSFFLLLNKPETCSDKIQNQNEKGIDCGGVCPNKCSEQVCKDKMPRRQCFLKMRKGGCKRAPVRAKCALSCRSCCGNLWGLKKCNRLKWHCQRNKRVSKKCRKSCKKC